MKIILTVIIACTLIINSYAQGTGQWEILNQGMSGWPRDINFVNDKVGWITGYSCILKTQDGGDTWNEIKPEVAYGDNLGRFNMISENIGWTVYYQRDSQHILKTEDSGKTWQKVYTLPTDQYFHLINVLNDSLAYIAAYYHQDIKPVSSLLKTVDGGDSWTKVLSDFPNRRFYELKLFGSDLALILGRVVVSQNGDDIYRQVSILRTKDSGESWDEILIDGFDESDRVHDLQYLNASTAYFLAEREISDSRKYYLYATTDSGKSWSGIYETEKVIQSYHFPDSKTGYVTREDSLGNRVIMKSVNSGDSWEGVSVFNFGCDKIYFLNPDTGFIMDNFSGHRELWKSNDGGKTWEKIIYSYPMENVAFVNKQRGFACSVTGVFHGEFGELYITNDGGLSWQPVMGVFGYSIMNACMFLNQSVGLCLLLDGKIRKTINSGEDWTVCYENNFDSTGYTFFENDIVMRNEKEYWAVGRGLWSGQSSGAAILGTVDGGETWNLTKRYLNVEEEDWNELHSIHSVGLTAWAVGNQGMMVKYTQEDQWQLQKSVTDLPLNKVFFSDENHGWIYGGYSNDQDCQSVLLRTVDGGQTWDEIHFDQYLLNDFYFADNLHGWTVGKDTTDSGIILESFDGGDNWLPVVENLSAHLNAIHFKDGYGWAVGYNGLILRTEDGSTWIDQNTGEKYPEKYQLFQNYPNPFNPITTIKYTVRAYGNTPQHVELSIYNLLGQKVATLVNKKQTAGRYQVEWDARGFATGIYYYRIDAGEFHQVKKMVLIK